MKAALFGGPHDGAMLDGVPEEPLTIYIRPGLRKDTYLVNTAEAEGAVRYVRDERPYRKGIVRYTYSGQS
jgi:hypothetical protein